MNTIRFGFTTCLLMLSFLYTMGNAQQLATKPKSEVEPTAFLASLKGRQVGVGDVIPGVSLFRIRAGIMTLPKGGFVGGVDFEVPSLHLFGLTTRIDGEAIFFNKTSFPITINEIYSKGLFHGLKIYVGAGAGIGIVFSGLLLALSRNPSKEPKLMQFALLGFALTEAMGLLAIMMAFLLLYSYIKVIF